MLLCGLLVLAVFLGTFSLPSPEELRETLWRDLLDRWFPACIDPAGGYRQRFGPKFEPEDDGSRGLVFQSRMVWVCATMAELRPEFREYAEHGVGFLKERLFDASSGAFVWGLDADGSPVSDERHAYGIAFAIYGLAAAGHRLGNAEALAMAQQAFGYLERHHRDAEYGGYFEATGPERRPRLKGGAKGDAIGTPYGQKSQNTHLHLMEAFAELYRAWPDASVRRRLEETLQLFTGPLFAEPGHLTLFVERNWSPASRETSYGHDIEAVHLMLDAAEALGRGEDGLVLSRVRALADNVLARGWDVERGGIFYAGDDDGPMNRMKNWWAEAEALLGFAALWKRTGDVRYRDAAAGAWAWIRDHQIDRKNGGWFEEAGRPEMAKGHAWKAAYHDGRALLFTSRLLG